MTNIKIEDKQQNRCLKENKARFTRAGTLY